MRTAFVRSIVIFFAAAATCAMGKTAQAQDDLVYVKKDSREATRQASLAASGAIRWPITWQIIGPFDNADGSGLDTVYPPEQAIKLNATYEGKGEQARWRGVNLRDGLRVSLARFKTSDDCVCYLYRKVESPKAMQVQVSIGSENQVVGWLNGKPLDVHRRRHASGTRAGHGDARLARGRERPVAQSRASQGQVEFLFQSDWSPPAFR